MTVEFGWYDEDAAIIQVVYTGYWTMEEHRQADEGIVQLRNQAQGRYDIIGNLSKATNIIPIGMLEKWVKLTEERHVKFPNWGLTVFVSKSGIFGGFFAAVNQLSPAIQQRCRLVETLEEAIQVIMADRQTSIE